MEQSSAKKESTSGSSLSSLPPANSSQTPPAVNPEVPFKKQPRRIVPTLISGPSGPPPSPVVVPSFREREELLSRQTNLLGVSLVLKIQQGKATADDIEARVAYLNSNLSKGQTPWTPDSLLEATGVNKTQDIDKRIKEVISRWEKLAELEEEDIGIIGESAYSKKARKLLASKKESSKHKRSPKKKSRSRSRSKSPTNFERRRKIGDIIYETAINAIGLDPRFEHNLNDIKQGAAQKNFDIKGLKTKDDILERIHDITKKKTKEPKEPAPALRGDKSPRNSRSSNKPCLSNQIKNPASGRCVSKSGKIGKKLTQATMSPKRLHSGPLDILDCESYTIKRIRQYSKDNFIPIPGKLTKKQEICDYVKRTIKGKFEGQALPVISKQEERRDFYRNYLGFIDSETSAMSIKLSKPLFLKNFYDALFEVIQSNNENMIKEKKITSVSYYIDPSEKTAIYMILSIPNLIADTFLEDLKALYKKFDSSIAQKQLVPFEVFVEQIKPTTKEISTEEANTVFYSWLSQRIRPAIIQ